MSEAPAGRLPRLAVTIPPLWVALPAVLVAETNVTPAGIVSSAVTAIALSGPGFVITSR